MTTSDATDKSWRKLALLVDARLWVPFLKVHIFTSVLPAQGLLQEALGSASTFRSARAMRGGGQSWERRLTASQIKEVPGCRSRNGTEQAGPTLIWRQSNRRDRTSLTGPPYDGQGR